MIAVIAIAAMIAPLAIVSSRLNDFIHVIGYRSRRHHWLTDGGRSGPSLGPRKK